MRETDFLDTFVLPTDYFVDICVDNCGTSVEYVNSLRKNFSTSLVFTGCAGVKENMERIVQIGPSIQWLDTGYEMDGYSFLLDILPEYDALREDERVKVMEDGLTYQNTIVERDYGAVLIGVKSQISSVFPIKSLLSIFMTENLILSRTYRNEEDFTLYTQQSLITINEYLGTNTTIEILSCSVSGRSLTAHLRISADRYIISDYKVTATLYW